MHMQTEKNITRFLSILTFFISIFYFILPQPPVGEANSREALWPIPDLSNETAIKPALSDRFGTWRTDLYKNGIRLSMDTVAGYQDVLSGGIREDGEAGGSFDLELAFDFEKLGLWQSGHVRLFAETRYGDFINADTGSLHAENMDGLYPLPYKNEAALTSIAYYHRISSKTGVFFGKLETLGRDANALAGGRGKTQFSNQNLVFNPVTLQSIPYAALGGGFFLQDTEEKAAFTLVVLDPNGKPNKIGLDEAFDDGATLAMEYRISLEVLGRNANQLLGLSIGTKDYGLAVPDDWLKFSHIPKDPSLIRPRKDETWCIYFNYDQFRYFEETEPEQGIGYFLRLGYADEATNPFEWFYSFGLSTTGIIPDRPKDTLGLGYYFTAISDELPDYLFILDDEQGMEFYYDITAAPWLHITPNFQIVDPANQFVETALIMGLRVKVDI